jgi:DnaD/phage-associated family protein
MNFKLQQEKIDFGSTSFENIFINDFMPVAKGDYVKVYLLGYKYAIDKEVNFSNETISKNLGIHLSQVNEAWEYWKEQGIVILNDYPSDNYKIEFVNLKQLYVENIYRHMSITKDDQNDNQSESSTTYDDLIEANKSETIRSMFRNIEFLMGRLVTPNEKRTVLEWISKYSATPEIIEDTFKYTIEKKDIKSLRYVEALLASWHDNNIHDKESLEGYLEQNRKNIKYYNTVKNHLGFSGRQLTLNEKKIIDVWVDEWGFTMEMIIEALSYSSKTTNPNLNYFNTILENWYKDNIKTPEQIKQFKKQYNKNTSNTKKPAPNKSFHNFEQQYSKLSEEELEKIARINYFDLVDDNDDEDI